MYARTKDLISCVCCYAFIDPSVLGFYRRKLISMPGTITMPRTQARTASAGRLRNESGVPQGSGCACHDFDGTKHMDLRRMGWIACRELSRLSSRSYLRHSREAVARIVNQKGKWRCKAIYWSILMKDEQKGKGKETTKAEKPVVRRTITFYYLMTPDLRLV